MIVYRLSKEKYADDIFGTGAEIHGGRWNNKGNKMLYTSSSRALAMVESAVHFPYGIMPKNYFIIEIFVPDIEMETIGINHFGDESWKTKPPSPITQFIGDNFLLKKEKLLLQVPSVVVSGDTNILINPLHKDFKKVKINSIEPFTFDDRLFFR